MNYGLVSGSETSSIRRLIEEKCDGIIIWEEDETMEEKLAHISLKKDSLTVITILSLEQLAIMGAKIYLFLEFLKTNKIQLHVLEKKITTQLTDTQYIDVIYSFLTIERNVRRDLTKKGIDRAEQQGIAIGRPRISEEKIEKIQSLYRNKQTYRDISAMTGISLGTISKYIRNN